MLTSNINSNNQKQKVRLPKISPANQSICIICSSPNCKQSIDHQYVNFNQLKDYALKARSNNHQIQDAKTIITQFYYAIHKNMKQQLQKQCLKARQSLNKHYYSYLTQLKAYQLKILCQVLQNDAKSLPNKKVWGVLRLLMEKTQERQQKNKQKITIVDFNQIQQKISQKIRKFNCDVFQSTLKNQIQEISSLFDQIDGNTLKNSKSRSNFSQASTNEQQVLQWRNIKIRNIVKSVVISCKKIGDPQFLLNAPKLQKFPKIIQFDARQNNLTHLSCAAFSNYLPQLISLDLRSNNIGDLGIFKMKNLSYLKQLMINQNNVGDQSALYILQGFPSLQLLWVDNNNITQRGALLLYQKSILKICSIVGNPIQSTYYTQLKSLFSRKGLIYL